MSNLNQVLIYFIGILLGIIQAFLFYKIHNYDQKDKQQDEKIEALNVKCNSLEEKLWPEDKLTSVLDGVVRGALNELKIELYEKGVLKPGQPKREKHDTV